MKLNALKRLISLSVFGYFFSVDAFGCLWLLQCEGEIPSHIF